MVLGDLATTVIGPGPTVIIGVGIKLDSKLYLQPLEFAWFRSPFNRMKWPNQTTVVRFKIPFSLHRAFGLSLATLKQQPCWSPQILVMALPVAVVTGANSGLGLALSVKLAKNHLVFAGMRSLAKKDQAEKG